MKKSEYSSAKKLKWGLLSTAQTAHKFSEAINQATRSEVIAVASRSLFKAKTFAQEYNIPRIYGGYDSLLNDPDVDVIYIALPNSLHAEWTLKAIRAGKHVLCEKPLVMTLHDLEAIQRESTANQVIVFEGLKHLHSPQIIKAMDLINQERLGGLQFINCCFGFYLPLEAKNNIRLDPELGGGAFWDVGVYPNSLAIMIAQSGPPTEVWAKHNTSNTGIDISMIGDMVFRNGILAQITCGFGFPFRYQTTQIIGKEGLLQISEPGFIGRQQTIMTLATKDIVEEIVTPFVNTYLREVETMEACVFDGAEPIVPLGYSRDFLLSTLAMYESARSGKVIQIQ